MNRRVCRWTVMVMAALVGSLGHTGWGEEPARLEFSTSSPTGDVSAPTGGATSSAAPSQPQPPSSSAPASSPAPSHSTPSASSRAASAAPVAERVSMSIARDLVPPFFNGVEPGASTVSDVQRAWGKPQEVARHNSMSVYRYNVEPFEYVDVEFDRELAVSIVIRLREPFAPDSLAKELGLTPYEPVLIYNDAGQTVGQAYPERGMALSFEVGSEPPRTTRIVVERPAAESFVLRGLQRLAYRASAAQQDLETAIDLVPEYAPAHYALAILLYQQGRHQDAARTARQAVMFDPENAEYRLLAAKIYGTLGDYPQATQQTESVLGKTNRPELKALAVCQLGDLVAAGPQRDYKLALDYHMQAIKFAQTALAQGNVATRRLARKVLLDAHLAAAGDIAFGPWGKKSQVVPKWFERAEKLAADTRSLGDGEPADHFLLSRRALAACVGMEGHARAEPWLEMLTTSSMQNLERAHDEPTRQRVEWEYGSALYDAMQCAINRGEIDHALEHGQRAVAMVESASSQRQLSSDENYMIGRLYFRLGSIHAIQQKDHREAVRWFDKSLAALASASEAVPAIEARRAGDTLISMAVSYWGVGDQERAVALTQQGIQWIQFAVSEGYADEQILAVPYTNMATMLEFRGNSLEARQYQNHSARLTGQAPH